MQKPFKSYNERLFSGGLRQWVHEQRFNWLRQASRGLSGSVLELGCFDARSLGYLAFAPDRYLGIDAGWSGGLDAARVRYPQHEFLCESSPRRLNEKFDVAICLETLEHVPRAQIETYIEMLHDASPVLLCTIPVEIGPVFLIRYLSKFIYGTTDVYSAREVINLALNRPEAVVQDDHKGFDYRRVISNPAREIPGGDSCGLADPICPLFELHGRHQGQPVVQLALLHGQWKIRNMP